MSSGHKRIVRNRIQLSNADRQGKRERAVEAATSNFANVN